ncbi:uncharacterized protein LOC126584673 isoform X2 [Malus sylvestris]|uniref:uncharacterized protein LOC126584673 isoform X2 n=1 Tax=Malus sylvestris TaxID=3752 RepID=UPI0021AD46E4|nr:uncharacterized protein LOC126584673 isoform X2 [Malus sylvestris]
MLHLITRRRSVSNTAPALSASTAPGLSAPLIGEPTPLSARRSHRRRREPEPYDHSSSSSRVEGGDSQPAKKNTRGPNRMLKEAHAVRLSASLIKIAYDSRHRGAATSQQHSSVVNSCGFVIRYCCPMQWTSWAQIPEETKELVRDKLTVNFDLKDISPEVSAYLEETLANRYKDWKCALHKHFQLWGDPEIARLQGYPAELKDRLEDWEWLCKHFTDPKFVKSVAGMKARDSKTLLHHSGSKPFSYRLEARRQEGSKFPQIDLFKDVYVRPGKEIAEQLLGDMVEKSTAILEEATSQLSQPTPIEDVIVPEDADLKIVTQVLDQKLGCRHGKVVRCMGKAGVRETGASSSRSSTVEVNSLKEEVTTLRGQLVAQNERMNMIVQALAMSGLQIPMPEPNLAPPSTS